MNRVSTQRSTVLALPMRASSPRRLCRWCPYCAREPCRRGTHPSVRWPTSTSWSVDDEADACAVACDSGVDGFQGPEYGGYQPLAQATTTRDRTSKGRMAAVPLQSLRQPPGGDARAG